MEKEVLVSINVVTYNHKDYIKQCLDGILMQQTNFRLEIILGEDESNDGTREICIAYANNYPDKIKLFLRKREDVIYINSNPTGRFNFIENLKACSGKYIALCEGDDYWTDSLKLQKQFDFLEANKDVNICFHRSKILRNEALNLHSIPQNLESISFNYIELLRHYNFITTASVVFRKPKGFTFPDWFYNITFGDLGLYKIVLNDKEIHCINEVMSVYRVHDKGLYSGISILKARQNYLSFYKTIFSFLNLEEKKVVTYKIQSLQKEISKLRFPKKTWLGWCYYFYLRLYIGYK